MIQGPWCKRRCRERGNMLGRAAVVARSQALLAARALSSLPDYTLLPLPALSPTMETGNLASWNKAEGDLIEPGDVIAEVETDKAVVDYEAQETQYLAKILVAEGTKDVTVGATLGVLVEEEADIAAIQAADASEFGVAEAGAQTVAAAAATAPAAPAATPPPPPPPSASAGSAAPADELHVSALEASPAAAHHMRTHGVSLGDVQGSGRGGRVTKGDVMAFLAGGGKGSAPTAYASIAATPLLVGSGAAAGAPPAAAAAGPGYRDETPSQIRAIIAKRLQESKTGIPHFFVEMECTLDGVLSMRKRLNTLSATPVSVNDIVVRASALALRDVPAVNSYYDVSSDSVLQNDSVDISIAVATPGGLITPIVTSVDQRGYARCVARASRRHALLLRLVLLPVPRGCPAASPSRSHSLPAPSPPRSIASTVRELAGRARKNKLQPHEFQGGSFTVSNLGMFGIDSFNAIINPPQACILAVGGGSQRVVVNSTTDAKGNVVDEPATATVMSVQLSCDRRAVDELDAAKFLQCFRAYINTPELMSL